MDILELPADVKSNEPVNLVAFVEKTNIEIMRYNRLMGDGEKREQLLNIRALFEEVDSNLSMRELSKATQYHVIRSKIQDQLIKEESSFESTTEASDITLGELISKMSSEKIDLLFTKLKEGSRGTSLKALNDIYDKEDQSPEAVRFLNFLQHNSIRVLSEGNCINILCESETGNQSVLKLDVRMGRSKSAEFTLRKQAPEYLAKIHAERYVKSPFSNGVVNVIDFFENGSLFGFREKQQDEALSQTGEIFCNMAKALTNMQEQGIIFFDAKLDNWLIDEQGKICIADSKSFSFLVDGCFYYGDKGHNRGLVDYAEDIIKTPGFDFPERLKGDGYKAEPVHAYLLGKNLYYFLAGKNMIVEGKLKFKGEITDIQGKQHTIEPEVFNGIPGKLYKSLISALTKTNPDERISLKKAIYLLKAIDLIKDKVMKRSNADVLEKWAVNQFNKILKSKNPTDEAVNTILKQLDMPITPLMSRRTTMDKLFRRPSKPILSTTTQVLENDTKPDTHHTVSQAAFKQRLRDLQAETSTDAEESIDLADSSENLQSSRIEPK